MKPAMERRGQVVGYVPGVYDMFHIGHLNILLNARPHCDQLIVGVVTDERTIAVKGRAPMVPLAERIAVVRAIDLVDLVVVDDSVDKAQMWERLHFDVLFKGDDWQDTPKGDALEASMSRLGVRVHYFPYTKSTSSSRIRELIGEKLSQQEHQTVPYSEDTGGGKV